MKLNEKDVGMNEDMSSLLKQLICAEDHITNNIHLNPEKWMYVLNLIREIRSKWLSTIVKEGEGNLWCITKHLLAATENLIEVGTRFSQSDQLEESRNAFEDSKKILFLLFKLNNLMEEDENVSAEKVQSSA